jgi:hypothetical protein
MAGNVARMYRALKDNGELIQDAMVTHPTLEKKLASSNVSISNQFSSTLANNKSVIDGISASVSNMSDTITKNNVANLNATVGDLYQAAKQPSDLSLSTSKNLFSSTNVLFEEAYMSVDSNIKDVTASVLFAKSLTSNPDEFSRTTKGYIDYSTIRQTLEAKHATLTDSSSTNVGIFSTNFVENSTTTPIYDFTFNNIMFSKYESFDFNKSDNRLLSFLQDRADGNNTKIKSLSENFSNILNNHVTKSPTITSFFHVQTLDTISQSQYPVVVYAYFYKYANDTDNIWSVIFSSSALAYPSILIDKTSYKAFTDLMVLKLNTWGYTPPLYSDDITTDFSTAIEYKSPLSFNSIKCVSSEILGWAGKFVTDLIMPTSNYDVVTEYKNTITKLWNYFPELYEGDIVMISGSLEDHYYCNIIKIVSVSGKLCFIQQHVELNDFFPGIDFKNDLTINGTFNVKNMYGEDVIKTDNVSNIMTISQKVGINQQTHEVKGLLDIDNMANKTVDIILNNFTKPLLDSYELTEKLKAYVIPDGTGKYVLDRGDDDEDASVSVYVQEILAENKFATFSCPILQSIDPTDISFDHRETNILNPDIMFSTGYFNDNSFAKIKTIVSNLSTMLNPISEDGSSLDGLNPNTSNILSFCELLGDTNITALCSIRAIIKPNSDNNGYVLYCFVTYSNMNKYYNDHSYRQNLESLCDSFGRIHQFLNYANFLIEDPTIQANMMENKKTNDTEGLTFSGHINNSPFFRNRFGDSKLYVGIYNYPGDPSLYLLHEAYRFWENKPGITNFIPNTDVQVNHVLELIHNSHKQRFGEYKMDYTFPVQYDFNTGPKLTFVKTIEILGTKYILFCGMNITDYIDLSIISKGDNRITGNLSVVDEGTTNNIFNVDTLNKQCSSMYNTGIGTNNPRTKLDINDCGLYDVIQIENLMAERLSEMNKLLANLKTYMGTNGDANLAAFFNSQTQLVQDHNHYYSVNQLIYDEFNTTINLNVKHNYHYLYPTWNNKAVKDTLATEVQNKSAINYSFQRIQDSYDKNMYYDGSFRIKLYEWINGLKISLAITFKVNGNFYTLLTGIDLQNFVTINTNRNIQLLTETLSACGNIFQDMVASSTFKAIPNNQILNKNVSKTNREMSINKAIDKIKMFKYEIDTTNIENTMITTIDPMTYTPTSAPQLYKTLTDFQLKNKTTFIVLELNSYYDIPLLSAGQYGIIHSEDDYVDYITLFWVKSNTNGILTIYSQEITIKDIIIPSLQLKGDAVIRGDLYLYDNDKKENFIVIDSDNRFMGFNTSQVYGNYSNGYATTSNNDLAKHNVYIRTDSYPNTVIERQAERDKAITSPQGRNPYYYFKPFTTLSSRRQSEYFTFNEMAQYKDLYWAKNESDRPNAYGDNRINQFAYGSIVSFEIKDKTGVIKELGGMGVLMESMKTVYDDKLQKEFNDVHCGFEVNVVDRLTGSTQTSERVIMYCSNDSNLYVNNVTTNKINFNNNEKLLTGQTNGNPYAKPPAENKTGQLWVHPGTGDLMFTNSDGDDKKVKLE